MTKQTDQSNSFDGYIAHWDRRNNLERLSEAEIANLDVFCLTHFGSPFYWIRAKLKELEQNDPGQDFGYLHAYMNLFLNAHKNGNWDAALGWLHAFSAARELASLRPLAMESRIRRWKWRAIKARGDRKRKADATANRNNLHAEINWLLNDPMMLLKGASVFTRLLMAKRPELEYSESTIKAEVKKLFAKKRREIKGGQVASPPKNSKME